MADATKQRRATEARLSDAEIDAQVPAARAREATARAIGLRAKTAHYDAATKRVVLELTNGVAFAFPARLVRGLERATAAQRSDLVLSPSGSGVIWEALDADISVPGLLASTFGRAMAASAFGKAGGQVRSLEKARAARANGAMGGRPRKQSTS